MRIGMMLRSLDEKGGIGVYTNNLIHELLRIDDKKQYVFFYRKAANIGRFAHFNNVAERVVSASNKAFWDQIAIPLACWREKVDVVFNPKFTAPLLAPCKAVMVVHGADWFIPEQAQFYGRLDVQYIRMFMPLYFRKCDTVISVSQLTTDNFNHVLKLPAGKLKTVYMGPGRHFKRLEDESVIQQVRDRYNLPEKFILTLTKCGGGGDRRKNFGRILQAYAHYHGRVSEPHKLVVGGEGCEQLREAYEVPTHGYGRDVLFPGWLDQQDLPAIYSMADLYLHPSNLEAFPQPVVEAMACGTPLITSNTNGLREIAGNAAILVNPEDTEEIAKSISRVLREDGLRAALSEYGLTRSRMFSWDRCARETLTILEKVYMDGG
jgi:glycosyltransferase involved in cell wall biosynthesis